jgi:LAO/AO transport system kinase
MRTAQEAGAALRNGDRRALARVLSWIEAGDPRGRQAIGATAGETTGQTYVLGVTGAPGAGKSTLTSELVAVLRREGRTVGVLAVDPSSAFSGGALLGDRIRMAEHQHDAGVYIRSMATRGRLGGLALAVPAALQALAAYGVDWVLVETVGVGQLEIDIVEQADTTLVVVAPGWGDDVQASKAGLMEIADVFVVNKDDLPGAEDTAREIDTALAISAPALWHPPVIRCAANKGAGVEGVWAAVTSHREHLLASGRLAERRRRRRLRELRTAVRELAWHSAERALADKANAGLLARVAAGETDPTAAARLLLDPAAADLPTG